MVLLCSIASGVGYEEMTVIEGDAFRLVAHLGGSNGLEGADVNLGYEALLEIFISTGGQALVAIAGDVDVAAVGAQLTVVGNVLGGCHGLTLRGDELHDVRPVDSDGDEAVVHLYDVIGRVAKLLPVLVAKPLVADHLIALKVGQTTIVGLPHALVQQDEALLR